MNRSFSLALILLLLVARAGSAQDQNSDDTFHDPTGRVFELVLPSEHLFGDWNGLRTKLEAAGITPRLIEVTDIAGNPIGGRSQGITEASSIELSLFLDLRRIMGLEGGSIFISSSERWGSTLSKTDVGNVFSTQQIWGFETIRLIDFSYQQKLLDDRIELRLGRFSAMDGFPVSPFTL